MFLSLTRRLTSLAVLALLLGGTAVTSSAQDDDLPKSKKKTPPKSDDDVIVPGKKTTTGAPAAAKSLPALLKQANLKYDTQENDDGTVFYKVTVTVNNEKTTVLCREVTLGKTKEGEPVKAAMLITLVAAFPEDYKATLPLHRAVSDYNDRYIFGKGIVGPRAVVYSCPFWLRNADAQTLLDHLYLSHMGRLELKRRVQAIFDEEAQ